MSFPLLYLPVLFCFVFGGGWCSAKLMLLLLHADYEIALFECWMSRPERAADLMKIYISCIVALYPHVLQRVNTTW